MYNTTLLLLYTCCVCVRACNLCCVCVNRCSLCWSLRLAVFVHFSVLPHLSFMNAFQFTILLTIHLYHSTDTDTHTHTLVQKLRSFCMSLILSPHIYILYMRTMIVSFARCDKNIECAFFCKSFLSLLLCVRVCEFLSLFFLAVSFYSFYSFDRSMSFWLNFLNFFMLVNGDFTHSGCTAASFFLFQFIFSVFVGLGCHSIIVRKSIQFSVHTHTHCQRMCMPFQSCTLRSFAVCMHTRFCSTHFHQLR